MPQFEVGRAGTLHTQTEAESSHRKRKAGTYMGKKKPQSTQGSVGPSKTSFLKSSDKPLGCARRHDVVRKLILAAVPKHVSWLLKNNLHFKPSVPSLYLRFCVCIYFCWNIFRSCVLHFYLRGWRTVHTLGSIRTKPQLACNLEIQGLLYADFK